MTAKTRWTLVIVGLLAANLLAMAFLAVTSARWAPEVIPGYDQPARHEAHGARR